MGTGGLAAQEVGTDTELINYKSGIDVTWGGVKGVDYMEEYLYSDKLVDDHKVVYIRSTTPISMKHNERNIAFGIIGNTGGYEVIGVNGKDGVANTGDEGIIRYNLDRDRQYNYLWSDDYARAKTARLFPAYIAPFTLASQTYQDAYAVSANAASDLVTISNLADHHTSVQHGIPDGTAVTFPVLTGGQGLAAGSTVYYTRDATGMSFKVSTVKGGAAVNITSNYKTGMVQLVEKPAVVGTTGPNGTHYASRTTCYFRGLTDSAGDEWHTLSYADDTNVSLRDREDGVFIDQAYYVDDGKTVALVVNPKTPGMTVRATGNAQFYTTPPKAYWTPKICDQTTYLDAGTGTVTFEIRDLYGANVQYRINGGEFIDAGNSAVTLDASRFNTGMNTLQYRCKGNTTNVKTRMVCKNPTHPSKAEKHGNYLWMDDAGYKTVLERSKRAPYATYYKNYTTRSDSSGQANWDAFAGRGLRYIGTPYNIHQDSPALINVFVAKVAGFNFTRTGAAKSYGQYARQMLVDHPRTIDRMGFEMYHTADGIPREVNNRGYYESVAVMNGIFAYDIMAGNFRSDQVAGGMTAIEDYFIRDTFAGYVYDGMMWGADMCALGNPGLGGGVRMNTAAYVAMILPEYSSPCYGTSGFGTVQTTYPLCPYQDDRYTWKQGLFDIDKPKKEFPNLKYYGRWSYNGPSGAGSIVDIFIHKDEMPGYKEGDFRMKEGYYAFGTGGIHLQVWANMAKRWGGGVTDPLLEKSFTFATDSSLLCAQDTAPYNVPRWYNLFLTLNDYWPQTAEKTTAKVQKLPSNDNSNPVKMLQDAGPIGFAWYDDTYYGDSMAAPGGVKVTAADGQ